MMIRILLVVLACALAACRSDVTYMVLLVGDSLADGAEPAIRRKLLLSDEAGFSLLPNPISGTAFAHAENGSQYWLDRGAALMAAVRFDAVVVSLGINDATLNADPSKRVSIEEMQAAATRFLNRYAIGGRQVFWMLPHSRAGNTYRGDVVIAISAAAAGNPSVHWIDIEQAAAARGIAFAGLLQPDRLHFNDAGNELIAEVVHDQLAADARARGLDR